MRMSVALMLRCAGRKRNAVPVAGAGNPPAKFAPSAALKGKA
jgi:hypothetical protein